MFRFRGSVVSSGDWPAAGAFEALSWRPRARSRPDDQAGPLGGNEDEGREAGRTRRNITAVAVAIAVRGPVFLPQQQQCHAAPFEFPVHLAPVRKRLGRRFLKRRWREQPPLQLAVVHALRLRPGDANDSSPPQIFADRRAAHPNRHRNLPLARPKGVAQSQDFSYLAHRRSLGGHRTSPCLVAKGNRVRNSIADSESLTPPSQGGRIASEWVADFRRNRWPLCVGTTGRFASDYALRGWTGLTDAAWSPLLPGLATASVSRRACKGTFGTVTGLPRALIERGLYIKSYHVLSIDYCNFLINYIRY